METVHQIRIARLGALAPLKTLGTIGSAVGKVMPAVPGVVQGVDTYKDTLNRLEHAAKTSEARAPAVKAAFATLPSASTLLLGALSGAGALGVGALGSLLGTAGRTAGGAATSALGDILKKHLVDRYGPQPNAFDDIRATLLQSAAKGFGEAGGKLLAGGVEYGIQAGRNALTASQAKEIYNQLIREDPEISRAYQENPTRVDQAWGSMLRFSPTLASDINAARSYLRVAVTSGAGPDAHMLSMLARGEHDVREVSQ